MAERSPPKMDGLKKEILKQEAKSCSPQDSFCFKQHTHDW